MNYFNHQNVQLAYEAVYNQDLCESMEDLGLIDGYDYLIESPASNSDPRVTGGKGSIYSGSAPVKRTTTSTPNTSLATINRPVPGDKFLGPTVTVRGARYGVPSPNLKFARPEQYQRESYDIYDIILEYLIQEGYADTLGSAEIILENMSEDWIEEILEASVISQQKGVAGRVQVRPVQQGGFGIGKIRVGSTTVNRPVPGTFRAGGVSSRDAARYNNRIDNPDISAAERQSELKRSGHSGFIPVRNPSSIPDTGIPGRPSPGRSQDQTRARIKGY